MRFWPEPEPYWLIEPELSSTSATSSVFFSRISVLVEKLMSALAASSGLPIKFGEDREEDAACS